MRLTDHDASFLYQETASGPMSASAIYLVEGVVSFSAVYEHYAGRIHLVDRLRQKLAFVPMNLAHPKWVDDPDFDLDNHVLHRKLPAGSTMDDGVALALALNEEVLDRSRPLWRLVVIEGLPDTTLILQQIHHAMVDGASAIQLSMVLLDFEEHPEPIPAAGPWAPSPVPTAMELMTEAMRENTEQLLDGNPMDRLRSFGKNQRIIQRGMQAMSKFFTQPAITAPWNAGSVGPKRDLKWFVREFATFREIRRQFGGTINDIALALVTEGAARYLDAHEERTEGQNLRLMCPVNVRTESDADGLGNRVSAIFPTLPASQLGIVERLRVVIEETSQIKEAQEAQAVTLMQEASPTIPPVLMAPTLTVGTPYDMTKWAADNPLPVLPSSGPRPPNFGFNFTCTNVPGVQVQQYLAGHKITSMLGILMLGGNLGYGSVVTSYNGDMILTFTADIRLMPDLDLMADEVEAVFDELLAAARAQQQADAESAA
jgi:WS/DGAT/MGAT family acyltransferase